MARKLRVQYPGAIYHVMSRGDHLEAIYRDRTDPELFLATLAEACSKTDCQVHAFCLMSNHFHLVIALPGGNGLLVKWRRGGRRSKGETQRASREAGAAEARSFGRSCCSK